MLPLQALAFLSSILMIYFLVCWFIYFDLEGGSCYSEDGILGNFTCEHSIHKCGDSSITLQFPFRSEADPKGCRYPRFNLSCQHNRTVLYLFSADNHRPEYYYADVHSIDYKNGTIRVSDPGLQKENCSTFPLNRFPRYFTEPGLFNIYLQFSPSDDTSELVFLSCKSPMKLESSSAFHHLVDTATCNVSAGHLGSINHSFSQVSESSSYNYVVVGEYLSASDIGESCTFKKIVPAQIDDQSLLNRTWDDIPFQYIHNLMADGFKLQWRWGTYSQLTLRKPFRCYIVFALNTLQHIITYIVQASSRDGRLRVHELEALVLISTARNLFGSLLLMAFLIYKWRRRHLSMYDSVEVFLKANNSLMPIRYSYREIKSITNNFKEKLGEGGYGCVYKGKLRSGSLVAIKMLNKPKANGQEFINEVVTIGRIHHVNVVRLVGFCVTSSKRALVYEYMPNGSLDKFIFSDNINAHSLSWEKAYKIALGVARGIEYLHQGCNMQILHFDIKPHNILLDEHLIPKVSDFGLAKLYPAQDGFIATLTAIRGTIGYIAPELIYKNIGRVSYKADVYSFGMLLMDMIGRKRNISPTMEDSSDLDFPLWIFDKFERKEDIQIGEATTDEDKEIVKKLILVSLWCIQMIPSNRPSMREAVEMLEGDVAALELPPKPLLYSTSEGSSTSSFCKFPTLDFEQSTDGI